MKEIIQIVAFMLLIVIMGGLAVLGIFYQTDPKVKQCISWRTVTSIENYPMSNFWENKIVSIVKYDDGSSEQTDWGDYYKIGRKTCTESK